MKYSMSIASLIGGIAMVATLFGGAQVSAAQNYVWPTESRVMLHDYHQYRHKAVDFKSNKGDKVLAAQSGTIIEAKHGYNGGYGTFILIQHENNVQTQYAHLSKVLVKTGDIVTAGQVIGEVGKTGRATEPHLHFEVRTGKNLYANPLMYLGK